MSGSSEKQYYDKIDTTTISSSTADSYQQRAKLRKATRLPQRGHRLYLRQTFVVEEEVGGDGGYIHNPLLTFKFGSLESLRTEFRPGK